VATRMSSISEASGYVLEPLREGADFTLYRGRQHGNPSSVLAVALSAEQSSPQSLRRLEHEYSLAAELDPSWAAKPLALTRHEGRTVLLLKDPGGEPLDLVLQRGQGQPLDLTRFLRIAISLTTALGQVHRRGLLHKDIKPANVLVDDAGKVWLTGFGMASELPHERQSPVPPEIIAGTLAYMAPEQTGRMNRSIDARSDLYSLGVTLYQMLTGALPFSTADPLEWVHCHIAREPISPGDRAAVPGPLSAITMKLLAKNAEERYQTASGLEADLRHCLKEWESHERIDSFPLGADDASDRLVIPERLYGRECEIEALVAAFDRVVAYGATELVVLSGYSGVGKSSVVNELHKALVPPRGLFAGGKFDQYKRDIPYATLAQAFQTLLGQILVKSQAEVEQWRHTILEAVGTNGQLIVSLIPELEFIIGKQPPVSDLPPRDAQNRFQMVFRRFLCAFARPEHPFALFLDDLQWLDAATLDLIERLVTHPEVRHLMIIGAYRDNEVTPSHPLVRTLEAIRRAGVRVREIVLAPLGLDDVSRLVGDALHCEPERARPFAQLVQEKTGGNPFFAIQFFTAMAEEGLLGFDSVSRAWQWDMNRIRAKSYTDNVVDLMAGKLRRLSPQAQEAVKQLACLGNVADSATLALVHGETEQAIHGALREAVRAGLVLRQENDYRFLHDRIQQGAYSLIREEHRAETHLRIGRALLASMMADQLAERLFDVANQLNRGAALLIDRDEKSHVATINLRAGRKAKASAAYESALAYFSAGMALLDERDWGGQYELTFSLWLERAQCEFLTGNFDRGEQLIEELLQRGESKVDQAAVYQLKIQLHIVKSENHEAVASAITCLRLFGIDLSAHPTQEQVQTEYDTVWQTLDMRPIESLIDLPLMTDPEMQAAMQVLSVVSPPAYLTDFRLCCFLACCMVKAGMQHGTSGASALAFGYFGSFLGPVFHRYTDGYRFAKLACDLVEKHDFIAYQAKIYHTMGTVTPWTQPISSAIDFMRATFRTAIETGDLTYACYGMTPCIAGLLLRNDPLDAVWRESEMALEFTRGAKYGDVADIIRSQQRFIANMQGRTTTFSTFSDAQFDEATFEAQLTGNRMALMIFWYWMLKLKARFLSGDYAEALAAAGKVKVLLWTSVAQIQQLDYFYYAALTVAACYENASANQQQGWRELLTLHRERLREWAETYPPTFADKHALVLAEIARLEGRDLEAMSQYEQAILLAREHGFVQNEGLAYEVAARFYSGRGFETIAHAYLWNARNCYDRWGALGKVKQLDELYPHLRKELDCTSPIATIGTLAGQLDIETVIKASQALSSEIDLPKLIEKLMRIAVEHAGAQRGLLVLLRGDEPQIEAEAVAGHKRVDVTVRRAAATPSEIPQSALHYVIRTRARVVLDDASVANLYAQDEYVRAKRTRSVLCMPIVKQTKLIGALYLENNLTPGAFTPERLAVLEMLASQAAISLENATLYSDLHRSEAFLAQGQRLSHTGSFGWNVSSGEIYWSDETYNIFDYERAVKPTLESLLQRIHPDDRDLVRQTFDCASEAGTDLDFEHRLLMPDGSVKHLNVVARTSKTSSGNLEFVGSVTDISAAKHAEDVVSASEKTLRLIVDGIAGLVAIMTREGEVEFVNNQVLEYFGKTIGELKGWSTSEAVHPDDLPQAVAAWRHSVETGDPYDIDHRLRRADGAYRWFHSRGLSLRDAEGGVVRWYNLLTDIDERRRGEEKLRRSEAYLSEAQKLSHTGSFGWNVSSGEIFWSEETYKIFEYARAVKPRSELVLQRIHPDDRDLAQQTIDRATEARANLDFEHRLLMPDGSVKYVQVLARALETSSVNLEYVGAVTDVTAAKRAEQRIRQSEMEVRQILDFAPQYVAVLGPDSDRTRLYANQTMLNYFGFTLEEWRNSDRRQYYHPDDWERLTRETQSKFSSGIPHEYEARFLRKDGHYRWFLFRWSPLRDEQGRVTRWYAAATDIEERKQAEQRLQNENVALREEIDKASMFEEIVGVSPALHAVLSRVSKVAPTDSTVLITGETGTGKELIARAVHKRSKRSSRAFVSVNCAAVPRDLIASELFGHEKGAFTGATQRRLGRFELAEGGTIFLDEVGELPAETQIALLRVLQEHEFERVGGTGSIRTNVRVIAATNRDLQAAIAAGIFRSDLFYRLNVFPIEVPPLRERVEDISVLVEYLIDRYARKAGKNIRGVNKRSLELLQSYPWPGNVRELQNVIERSVIVCETENLSVDQSWLSRQPHVSRPQSDLGLSRKPATQEKEIIEAALRESGGRVSGPSGAAAKLGIHRSTLESKIVSLKIDKYRFKTASASKNS
jgi:PAS domain S-box-containing protein